MAMSKVGGRLYDALRSPWVVGMSVFGLAYGGYQIIDMTQSGKKYILEADLTGKTYIVTGATSGIGRATTEELAKRNARVIMACRDRQKCISVRRDVVLTTGNKQVYCRQCDLSDFESVKEFASKVLKGKFELDRIDGIVNNAAILKSKREVTAKGIEQMLATNFLGTFLVTGLLLPKLLAQDHPSRIVFVNTNLVNKVTGVDLDNLNAEPPAEGKDKFKGFDRYKITKAFEQLFTRELAERLEGSNVTVMSADPGRTKSRLNRELPSQNFFLSRWLTNSVGFFMGTRKAQKSTRPIIYALADPQALESPSHCIDREREPVEWPELSNDVQLREKVWAVAEKWTDYAHVAAELQNLTGTNYDLKGASGQHMKSKSGGSWANSLLGKLYFWG